MIKFANSNRVAWSRSRFSGCKRPSSLQKRPNSEGASLPSGGATPLRGSARVERTAHAFGALDTCGRLINRCLDRSRGAATCPPRVCGSKEKLELFSSLHFLSFTASARGRERVCCKLSRQVEVAGKKSSAAEGSAEPPSPTQARLEPLRWLSRPPRQNLSRLADFCVCSKTRPESGPVGW